MVATKSPLILAALLLAILGAPAQAQTTASTPTEFQTALATQARQTNPAFKSFSAERGQAFFTATHGNDWSCSTCHTRNPAQPGAHDKTKKPIDPLAPSANPRRFTDAAKVDKWFRRNCKDVLARECTPEEKGDLLAYLLTVKP
jgi:mono/diheme cytochrome c family protein